MPSTTPQQEAAHKAAIVAATGDHQSALTAARAAFDGTPANFPTYAAAVKNADAAKMRAIIASSVANGLGPGPVQSLYWLTGSYT
jgi:hypothetical protein